MAEVRKAGTEPRAQARGQAGQAQQSFKSAESGLFGSRLSELSSLVLPKCMRHFHLLLLLAVSLHADPPEELEQSLERFVEVFNLVDKNLADPIDPENAIYGGALPAMVRTLDPHSAFLDKEQFESLQEMQRSTEKGFGSVVSLLPGRVIVLQTLPGSPSERSGLTAGDEIVAVNGYQLSQLTIEQLVGLLGQSRQNRAELMVMRPAFTRLIPMSLVPAEMADPSVTRAFLLEDGIAHIKVGNFEQQTARELKDAIEGLGGASLKALVLDMRGNPGGLVEAAVQSAAYFLDPGQRILWIGARKGPNEELRVPPEAEPYKFPVAVLINSRTASAAELVAAALQDNGRAAILGERSFGKGIIQSVFSLSQGTALALTTAQYLAPKGRTIQRSLGDCRVYILTPCPQEADAKSGSDGDEARRGGVEPDQITYPRPFSELEAVIEATNSFFDFAKQAVDKRLEVSEEFEVTPKLLDDFQLFLSERRIRPGLSEWSSTLEFIKSRLKQEIFNLAFGVEKGDEIEIRRDPEVQAALQAVKNQ